MWQTKQKLGVLKVKPQTKRLRCVNESCCSRPNVDIILTERKSCYVGTLASRDSLQPAFDLNGHKAKVFLPGTSGMQVLDLYVNIR